MSIVVAGGGPAGLATALAAQRAGLEATVFEAATFGRAKMCGEFLSPDALGALRQLGLAYLPEIAAAPRIHTVSITVARGGRTIATLERPLAAPGLGVSRQDLDQALARSARHAGVEVRERDRVVRLLPDGRGVLARSGVRPADAVVVASGRVPGIGRVRTGDGSGWVGTKTHVDASTCRGRVELHFVAGAYVGLNDVLCGGQRRVNVCALATARVWREAGGTAERFWRHLAECSPGFARRWREASPVDGTQVGAASFGFAVRGAAGAGPRPPLFVGDAAAMIAPLCGDGQAMALSGGARLGALLAGHASSGALTATAVCSVARHWEGVFARRYRGRLRLGRALQRVLLTPASAAGLVHLARLMGPLPDWIYRRTRGPLPVPA